MAFKRYKNIPRGGQFCIFPPLLRGVIFFPSRWVIGKYFGDIFWLRITLFSFFVDLRKVKKLFYGFRVTQLSSHICDNAEFHYNTCCNLVFVFVFKELPLMTEMALRFYAKKKHLLQKALVYVK